MAGSLRDRAILTIMFQAGMGIGEFEYFNFHGWLQIKPQLERKEEILRIDFPKRKSNGQPFYSLIGEEGINLLKQYLEERGEIKQKDPIFIGKFGDPIKKENIWYMFNSLAKKVGLIPKLPINHFDTSNRYGINPHEMRDLFRMLWHRSGADSTIAEFMLGHTIDPLGYNKIYRDIDYVLSQYKKASF